MGLLGATMISFCCQVVVISDAGLKSGQTSPQKERGAVRNIVRRTNWMISLYILKPTAAGCWTVSIRIQKIGSLYGANI
ncbi:MAG TPA: hypothetical protein DCZ75_05815 [Geobacter sp.]|nr:hypothetical protein [Geobacter sp.]